MKYKIDKQKINLFACHKEAKAGWKYILNIVKFTLVSNPIVKATGMEFWFSGFLFFFFYILTHNLQDLNQYCMLSDSVLCCLLENPVTVSSRNGALCYRTVKTHLLW